MDNNFHLHLDQCSQCREQPFNLCVVGERLLKEETLKGCYTGPIGGGIAFAWKPEDGYDFTREELQ